MEITQKQIYDLFIYIYLVSAACIDWCMKEHAGCQVSELFEAGKVTTLHCFPSQEAEYIVTKIKQQQYQELLSKDQLNMERNDGKVFLHFGERCGM